MPACKPFNLWIDDLNKLFGKKNTSVFIEELEWISASRRDKFGIKCFITAIILEFTLNLVLYLENDKPSIFTLKIPHLTQSVTRAGYTLYIQRFNNLPLIEFKTRPNYSLTLPTIPLSEGDELEPLDFDQTRLEELFGSVAEINASGHLTFRASNSNGFSFIFKLDPESKTCQLTLLFHLYQDHVYSATFTGVTNIDFVVNDKGKVLQINGNIPDCNVFILFDHNFAMSPLTNKILRRSEGGF